MKGGEIGGTAVLIYKGSSGDLANDSREFG